MAGEPFEPELAAAAADLPEPDAMEALDELLARDLVRPTDVPRRFRFRHPLVRRAVYEAAPGGWRLGAHERTADALAARGAPAVERAHHVERSARHGDLAAVDGAARGGRGGCGANPRHRGAPVRRGRCGYCRQPPRPLSGPPCSTPSRRRSGRSGCSGSPMPLMLESLELHRDDPLEVRIRITAGLAGLENLLGRHREAHDRLLTAYDALPENASLRGRCPAGRARGRLLLPHGIRLHARVRPARGRCGRAARQPPAARGRSRSARSRPGVERGTGGRGHLLRDRRARRRHA